MALSIMSPQDKWADFKIKGRVKAEVLSESVKDDVKIKKLFISGEQLEDGFVKIYAEIYTDVKKTSAPTVIVLNNPVLGKDVTLISSLLKEGYFVMSLDVCGREENKEGYTHFPPSLAFADFCNAKTHLYSDFDDETDPWYVYVSCFKYAVKFLASEDYVLNIGAIASGEIANVLWQDEATDSKLDCAVVIGNAGWQSYRGIDKFKGIEPNFDDDKLASLASIEAQAYAKFVKCPTLILATTNSEKYDLDRVYDTASRISDRIYKAVDYTFSKDNVDKNAYRDISLFFKRYLFEDEKVVCPKELRVKLGVSDNKIVGEALCLTPDPAKLTFYFSEGKISSNNRSYIAVDGNDVKENTKFTASYVVNKGVEFVTMFVKATYSNGFTISSDVVSLSVKSGEVYELNKSGIIYSSRNNDISSAFIAEKSPLLPLNIDFSEDALIKTENAELNTVGATCNNGLLTFNVSNVNCNIKDDSIVLFDYLINDEMPLTVNLITDFYNEKKIFSCTVSFKGVNVWHNVKLELSAFKTQEGMPLRDLSKIEALSFNSESKFLINNVLWI